MKAPDRGVGGIDGRSQGRTVPDMDINRDHIPHPTRAADGTTRKHSDAFNLPRSPIPTEAAYPEKLTTVEDLVHWWAAAQPLAYDTASATHADAMPNSALGFLSGYARYSASDPRWRTLASGPGEPWRIDRTDAQVRPEDLVSLIERRMVTNLETRHLNQAAFIAHWDERRQRRNRAGMERPILLPEAACLHVVADFIRVTSACMKDAAAAGKLTYPLWSFEVDLELAIRWPSLQNVDVGSCAC